MARNRCSPLPIAANRTLISKLLILQPGSPLIADLSNTVCIRNKAEQSESLRFSKIRTSLSRFFERCSILPLLQFSRELYGRRLTFCISTFNISFRQVAVPTTFFLSTGVVVGVLLAAPNSQSVPHRSVKCRDQRPDPKAADLC